MVHASGSTPLSLQVSRSDAIIASLIETCKLNGVNPQAWLADTLTKLVNGWPMSRIDELMPWAYAKVAADTVKV